MESVYLYFEDIFWRCQYHTNLLCFSVALPWFIPTVGPESHTWALTKAEKVGAPPISSLWFFSPFSLGSHRGYELRSASNISESRL